MDRINTVTSRWLPDNLGYNNRIYNNGSRRFLRNIGADTRENSLPQQQRKRVHYGVVLLIVILVIIVLTVITLAVYFGVYDNSNIFRVKGQVRVNNLDYTDALEDPTSPEYQRLESEYCAEMDELYSTGPYADTYIRCLIEGFQKGSVFVMFSLDIIFQDSTQLTDIQEQVTSDMVNVADGTFTNVFEAFDIDQFFVSVVVLEIDENTRKNNDVGACINLTPCQHGGSCRETDLSYICDCSRTGYIGVNCELEIDECSNSPCQNGGNCTNTQGSYRCDCAATYNGINCELDHGDLLSLISQLQNQVILLQEGHENSTKAISSIEQSVQMLELNDTKTHIKLNENEVSISNSIKAISSIEQSVQMLELNDMDTHIKLNKVEVSISNATETLSNTIGEISVLETQLDDLSNDVARLDLEVSQLKNQLTEMTSDRETKIESAFTVHALSHTPSDAPYNEGDILIFSEELDNLHGHYSTATGKYTCPVTGIYLFAYTVRGNQLKDKAAYQLEVALTKSDTTQSKVDIYNYDTEGLSITASQSRVVQCNSGERVWLKVIAPNTRLTTHPYSNIFSGVLLTMG